MNETVLTVTNSTLIGANLLLGFAVLDNFNLFAGVVGILVTVAANVGKIAQSIAHVNAIRKNGWMPLSPPDQSQDNGEEK